LKFEELYNDEEAINLIINSLTSLLKIERIILAQSDAIKDEGTNSMISDFIKEQEKIMWMMKAWQEEEI
jgi:starvation-inducible DNA-binding protein